MTAEISSTLRPASPARRSRDGRGRGEVGLADGDDLRTLFQLVAVTQQLLANDAVVVQRLRAVGRLGLDQVDQDSRPLDVAEKLASQAGAGVGAFDQPGDVGEDEGAVGSILDAAEVGKLVVKG